MFNRKNKNSDPTQQPQPTVETIETKLYPQQEIERLNETVNALDELQQSFLAECVQKGLGSGTMPEAMLAAMQGRAYPTVVSTRPRRDNVRVLSFIHGTPPSGFLKVAGAADEFGLNVTLSREADDGSEWPTEPDPNHPTAFYVESYKVEPSDRIAHYGDSRDQESIELFGGLNTRLQRMLSPSEEVV